MKKSQSGFTLIELVVVIVLLGILGVTALGRFQDLSGDASAAAVQGVASELSASSALNYAEGVIDGSYTAAVTSTTACTTAVLANLFQSATFPSGFSSDATGAQDCSTAGVGPGGVVNCRVFKDDDNDSTFDAGEANATASIVCSG